MLKILTRKTDRMSDPKSENPYLRTARFTLWQSNVAIEHVLLTVDLSITNGDCP